ncbi:unnamed protein product [Amoebophrya sp. A25]|nr:unnamed protein product [Amoebophrya sp. A25]|eukprot:GSA25T00002655001.1
MSSRSGGSARGGIDKTVGSTIDGSAAPAPTPPGSGKGSATKSSALMLPGTEEMEVQDWLELWGIGYGQWKVSHCANGIWAADGAELLLLGSLVRAVTEEWNFSAFERGAIVGVVFIGVFFGNLLSGTLGDAIGTRKIFSIPMKIDEMGSKRIPVPEPDTFV